MYKEDLALNSLQWLICHKTQLNQIIYLIYMYKEDLALNNLQQLICHKTQPNKIIYIYIYIYLTKLGIVYPYELIEVEKSVILNI